MNRRQFFAVSAALAAVTACEQRKVHEPSTYRDVAAERLVPSLKITEPLCAGIVHRAGNLEAGDALMRRKVQNGDFFRPWEQIWVVCRVEALS